VQADDESTPAYRGCRPPEQLAQRHSPRIVTAVDFRGDLKRDAGSEVD